MSWHNESKRHSLSARGIKNRPITETEHNQIEIEKFSNEINEEIYVDHISDVAEELHNDKTLPFIKEDGIIYIRDEDGFIQVFDTDRKRTFEVQFHEEPQDFNDWEHGMKIASHPSVTQREYIKPGQYKERYKTYIGS